MTQEEQAQRGRVRMVVGLLIAVAAMYIFIAGATEGGVYFYEVNEALDQNAHQEAGKMVRIKGNVVKGTWQQKIVPKTINEFASRPSATRVGRWSQYPRPTPDVFQRSGEVV